MIAQIIKEVHSISLKGVVVGGGGGGGGGKGGGVAFTCQCTVKAFDNYRCELF